MPINGLLVTLSLDSDLASEACERIRERPELEAGERQDRWLPLVADAGNDREARDLHAWLEGLKGVEQVGVIMVGFEEDNPGE